jgi:pre-mRNA-processing factor 6
LKSAVFEREHGTTASALVTVKSGIERYPTCAKMYMIQGQLLCALTPPQVAAARESYSIGCKKCPTAIPMWILSSRLEESLGVRIKARSILEKGRHLNPKSENLWLESVKVEERDGSGGAKAMLARGQCHPCRNIAQLMASLFIIIIMFLGLQTLPTSGVLHSHSVWAEPRPTRKSRSVDALKKTNNAVAVIVTIARLFWGERKIDKARDWFARSVAAESDYGDAWAWWYRFEKNHGTPVGLLFSPSSRFYKILTYLGTLTGES